MEDSGIIVPFAPLQFKPRDGQEILIGLWIISLFIPPAADCNGVNTACPRMTLSLWISLRHTGWNLPLPRGYHIFLMERLACFRPLAGTHPGHNGDLPHLAEGGGLHVLRQIAGSAQEVLRNLGPVTTVMQDLSRILPCQIASIVI